MLQVGDAAWFQFIPMKFGNHIVNLSIFRDQKQIFGTSTTIEVNLSRMLKLQKSTRRFTGVAGIILPALSALIFIISLNLLT